MIERYSLEQVAHEFRIRLRPWWFCCGWRSYLCVADTLLHACHINVRAICDAHDRALMGEMK